MVAEVFVYDAADRIADLEQRLLQEVYYNEIIAHSVQESAEPAAFLCLCPQSLFQMVRLKSLTYLIPQSWVRLSSLTIWNRL